MQVDICLRLSYYGRMTVDVKLLLARHPLLFLFGEGGIKGIYCGSVLTAIGGGTRNIHPLPAVKSTGHKLTDEKSRREVAVNNKADIFPFTAYKASPYIIAGITKNDIHIVAHFAGNFK